MLKVNMTSDQLTSNAVMEFTSEATFKEVFVSDSKDDETKMKRRFVMMGVLFYFFFLICKFMYMYIGTYLIQRDLLVVSVHTIRSSPIHLYMHNVYIFEKEDFPSSLK